MSTPPPATPAVYPFSPGDELTAEGMNESFASILSIKELVTSVITLPATAAAQASALLPVKITSGHLVLSIESKNTAGGLQNYTLEIFDGAATGRLLYQASGITVADYLDSASFYMTPAASGELFVRITNIDADAMSVTVTVTAMEVTP